VSRHRHTESIKTRRNGDIEINMHSIEWISPDEPVGPSAVIIGNSPAIEVLFSDRKWEWAAKLCVQ